MYKKIFPDNKEWLVSEYPYADGIIMIKSRKGRGMRAHYIIDGIFIFTLRYSFCKVSHLLSIMKEKIDKNKGKHSQAYIEKKKYREDNPNYK